MTARAADNAVAGRGWTLHLDDRMSRAYDSYVRGTGTIGDRPGGPSASRSLRRTSASAGAGPVGRHEQGRAGEPVLSRLAYTVEEAALVVGVGRDLLYDEIRTGRLRSKKAGSRRVIARHHLLEWLDSDFADPAQRAG